MSIFKLRCRECEGMLLVVFGPEPITTVRVCPHCRAEVRGQAAIKALLRLVPVYARLLDKYPATKVTFLHKRPAE